MFRVTGPVTRSAIGVAGRGDEASPEALCVVDGAERGRDLELAAVARAGVDVAELERTLDLAWARENGGVRFQVLRNPTRAPDGSPSTRE